MRLVIPSAIGVAIMIPPIASAQSAPTNDSPQGQVAIGVGVAPRYEGSDDLRVIPFLFGDIRYRGVTLELRGLRGRVDLAADERLSIGPVLGARLNRADVEGPVGLLSDIGTAVEAGGVVGYRFGGDRAGQGAVTTELSIVHDISGTYDGLVVTAGAGYTALRKREIFVSVNVQTNWADGDYTRTYFGVTADDAARSGLSAYSPGSGFRDVGAGVTAGYAFNRRLGATARLGANYLVGDAADSPIIDSGSRWQPSGGLALSWRF